MIENYRGYKLEARREKCMAGYSLVYFSATSIKFLRDRVDDLIDNLLEEKP